MTTWTVVNDDTREKRRRGLVPRIALLACLALVVVSLGVALRPGSSPKPAEPPFSEQARSAALSEALRLRAAGEQLGQVTGGAGQSAVAGTVSLLTSHARALLVPGRDEPALAVLSPGPATASVAASPAAASSAAPGASESAPAPAAPAAVPLPASPAALATELAASAAQRLADAEVADGDMARLLAVVGTAQLLEASALAAAVGAPAPAVPDPAAPVVSGTCPTPSVPPSAHPEGAAAGTDTSPASPATSGPASGAASGPAPAAAAASPASLAGALAAAAETELETVYGYQVALTRLGGMAGQAPELLARHEALATDAEALSRIHCAEVPLREAGYTIDQKFLAAPAAGLGALEASALPVYGDLVALSEGETRQWAISGLVGASRRAAFWGAGPGALPGLAADLDQLPELPAPSPSP